MIPKDYVTAWRAQAPWPRDAQVEQDLVVSRAIVELFRRPELAERVAFRGATAIYKLHLQPAARYSEDIDLVQVRPEPIGETIDLVRSVLDPWLGRPRRRLKEAGVTLLYRFDSEDTPPLKMRLKIEINSREHFAALGLTAVPFRVDSRWFRGQSQVTTFPLNELLATKLRALYQRSKGRDLFDLWFALARDAIDPETLLTGFGRYMSGEGHSITRAQFEANLHGKSRNHDFRADIAPLLRPGIAWDLGTAMRMVREQVVARLPGEPWKGTADG